MTLTGAKAAAVVVSAVMLAVPAVLMGAGLNEERTFRRKKNRKSTGRPVKRSEKAPKDTLPTK